MSKITFVLRPANASGEHPISIKHTHSTLTPFVKATGVSIPAVYFDTKTGKVSNKVPAHVTFNAAIEQVRADVEKAVRNVLAWEEAPDRVTVSKEYDAILRGRENTAVNLRKIKVVYESFADELRHEIAELELQLETKKVELRDYEMTLGSFEGKLLKTFIERYRDEQKVTANTKLAYTNLSKYVKNFRPFWEITDVTPDTLDAFENHLIALNLNNSSVIQMVKRVKTVCLKYADVMQLNIQPIKNHRCGCKALRKEDVLFLTTEELQAFKELQVPKRREIVKDSFLLMCATGLRFSDSCIAPNHVKGNFIELVTKKTKTKVRIPLNDMAREILAKYSTTMPPQYLPNFTRVLKVLAEQAGIDESVYVAKRVGAEVVDGWVPKHTVISAHVGRKTFISHALASGVNPAVLKQWIGHSKMELMFSNYASGSMNTVQEMEKVMSL